MCLRELFGEKQCEAVRSVMKYWYRSMESDWEKWTTEPSKFETIAFEFQLMR